MSAKINKELLLEKGYVETPFSPRESNAKSLFQKTIQSKPSMRFVLRVWHFTAIKGKHNGGIFTAQAQFITKKGDAFDIEYHVNDETTVKSIEDFFIKIYDNMDCKANGEE